MLAEAEPSTRKSNPGKSARVYQESSDIDVPSYRTVDRPSLLTKERKATLPARHENPQRNPPYGSEPTVAKANAIGPCDPVCGFTELRTPEELALAYTGRGTLRRKNGSHHRDRARHLPDFGLCS